MSLPPGLHAVARHLHSEGFHMLPLGSTDDKVPQTGGPWKQYQTRQPTLDEMRTWVDENNVTAWAIICGTDKRVVCLDIEGIEPELFDDLLSRIPDHCKVRTPGYGKPNKGWHVWLEIVDGDVPRPEKMTARWTGVIDDNGAPVMQYLSEVKGEGGYAAIVGPNRRPPDDFRPLRIDSEAFSRLRDRLRALGDDKAAIRAEHGRERTAGDYRPTSGTADYNRADRDFRFFRDCVREYDRDLGLHSEPNPHYLTGREWRAQCPVHTEDGGEHSYTSLSFGLIRDDEGRARFVHVCHAGCDRADIDEKVGFWLSATPEGEMGDFEEQVGKAVHQMHVTAEARRRFDDATQLGGEAPIESLASMLQRLDEDELGWRFGISPEITDRSDAVLSGLWRMESSVALIANRKVGKSSIALQVCRSLLSGDPFFGLWDVVPVADDEAVVYLNYEVHDKMAAEWARDLGLDADRMFMKNLRGKRNPFLSDDKVKELIGEINAVNGRVLIVDPYLKALPSTGEGAENDASLSVQFFRAMEMIVAESTITEWMVVHHTGKQGHTGRGSSAFEGNVDGMWYVEKDQQSNERYFWAEMRWGSVDKAVAEWDNDAKLNTYQVGQGKPDGRSLRAQRENDRKHNEIRKFLFEHPGSSVNAIMHGLKDRGVPITHSKVTQLVQSSDEYTETGKGWSLTESHEQGGRAQ